MSTPPSYGNSRNRGRGVTGSRNRWLASDNIQMDVIIAGAGGHGRVVLDILRAGGEHNVVGFLDANQELHGSEVSGLKVLGNLNLLSKLKAKGVSGAIVAIGDNRVRVTYARKLAAAG